MDITKNTLLTNNLWQSEVISEIRCRACNKLLTNEELYVYNMDEEPDDLCFPCIEQITRALEELENDED